MVWHDSRGESAATWYFSPFRLPVRSWKRRLATGCCKALASAGVANQLWYLRAQDQLRGSSAT